MFSSGMIACYACRKVNIFWTLSLQTSRWTWKLEVNGGRTGQKQPACDSEKQQHNELRGQLHRRLSGAAELGDNLILATIFSLHK